MKLGRVDWMRVYELEQEIYGHVFTHLGAPPVTEHPQYLEGGDRFRLAPTWPASTA